MQYFPYLLGQGTVWYKPSLVTRVLKNQLWEELTLDFASLCYSLILRAYQWDYFHSSLIYKMSDPHCKIVAKISNLHISQYVEISY